MASFDGAYESLVQGVSEQVPSSRLPGQVTEQVNMVSDLVTGIRRRTGSKLRFTMKSEGVTNNLKAWKTDVGGVSTECYLNTTTGELIMLEEGNVQEMTRFTSDYLRAISPRSIRHAGVGDSLFIGNTERVPTEVFDAEANSRYRVGGYADVLGTALRQQFSVTVEGEEATFAGSYTTPNGMDSSHAQYVGTNFIVTRLLAALRGELWVFPDKDKGEPIQGEPTMEYLDDYRGCYFIWHSSTTPPTRVGHIPTADNIKFIPDCDAHKLPGRGNSFWFASTADNTNVNIKVDMPDGYIQLRQHRQVYWNDDHNTGTLLTVIRAEPSTTYRVYVPSNKGDIKLEFKTPDGTHEDHAQYITTHYIAQELLNQLALGERTIIPPLTYREVENMPEPPPVIIKDPDNNFDDYFNAAIRGNVLYVESKDGKPVIMTTGSGKIYIETSGAGIIDRVNSLPTYLPDIADGIVYGIGATGGNLSYFKYISNLKRWEETALPGSPTGIADMPVEIYWDGDAWVLVEEPFAGRLTGDSDTNPNPEFIDWGITGISSYQGRLVILSGSWVYLSATNAPRAFFRTTVEELLDSDPIGIGSSSASSASFEYGVVFNKDLVLFSPEHQALIPGLNQALTPGNAHILVTSTYTADMASEPVTLGSSVMYSIPRSSTHFGVMEMIPSAYTDSAYISGDASEHIPRYLIGRCRFAVSSTVGGMVLFGSSVDPKVLYVHEYLWVGEEKALRSWHRWEFETPIAYAFFSGELINIVTVNPESGHILVSNIDPKASDGSTIKATAYYMDNHTILDVERNERTTISLPECYANYIAANGLEDKVAVAYYGGNLNSMQIGSEFIDCSTIELNSSTTADKVLVGIPFESKLIPSPPVFKDYLDRPIVFNRVQLIKMYAMTDNTGVFTIEVRDRPRSYDEDYLVNPTRWLSTDLNLGRLPVGGTLGAIIPTRVDANTAEISFISEGLEEMNIINLEYTCKSGTMRKRR